MIVEGHEWYGKAEVRGASRDSIEADVRSLLTRMTAERRDSVVAELLPGLIQRNIGGFAN